MSSNQISKIDHDIGKIVITRRSSSKSIRARVSGYRQVSISAPSRISDRQIIGFIEDHENWLLKQANFNQPIFFTGMHVTPNTKLHIGARNTSDPNTLSVHVPPNGDFNDPAIQDLCYEVAIDHLREIANDHLEQRTEAVAREHKLKYSSLRIKNLSSRWGSCSSKRNINLNVQLMRLPQELIDLVIFHELTHTEELSHSLKFWKKLASRVPDYKEKKKQLRSYDLWRKPTKH